MTKYQKTILMLRGLQLLNISLWIGMAYLAYEIHTNLGIIMLLYVCDIITKQLFKNIQNDWSKK
jgi:hypothetical protein